MEPGLIFVFVIPLVAAVILAIWFFNGSLDRNRITAYIESRRGKVIAITWAPFGPGWFGGNKERIYEVRYTDHDDNIHQAYARTSMLTGVYFTEDRVVHYETPPIDKEEVESLEEENARLRAELERFKRKERDKNADAFEG